MQHVDDGLGVGDVLAEGGVVAHALALVLGLHLAIVATEGAFAHAERVIAERRAKLARFHALQVAERADAGGVEVGQ